METEIHKENIRNKQETFNIWRGRVQKLMPKLVLSFYNTKEYTSENERMLGLILSDINNPLYLNNSACNLDKIAKESILEVLVEDMFEYVYK